MPAANTFATGGAGAAFCNGFAITPHDTNELANITRAIWVGVAGNVKVTTVNGDTITLTAVPVGLLPIMAKIVFATGTTATTMVGLY